MSTVILLGSIALAVAGLVALVYLLRHPGGRDPESR